MLQMILMLLTAPDIDTCKKNQRLRIFVIKKRGKKIGKHTCIF